jgi:MoxR-like ATPase
MAIQIQLETTTPNLTGREWATLRRPQPTDTEVAGHFPREIEGQSIGAILDFARLNQKAVMITGEAGTGKSSTAEWYSATRGLPLAIVECNAEMNSRIVQGGFVPTGQGEQLEWHNSELATALGQESVVLLNEATRMSAKANALFLRILQERELTLDTHKNEKIKVHKNCLIIADANLDYRGVSKPDQAFMDRYALKVEFEYDEVLERNFIPSDSLLELAKAMRELARNENKFSTPISTRLIKEFVQTAKGLSFRFAVYNFVQNFPTDERQSVSMLLATYSQRISDELGIDLGDYEV